MENALTYEHPHQKELDDRSSGQFNICTALSLENEIFAVNKNKLITAPFLFTANYVRLIRVEWISKLVKKVGFL